MRDKKNQVRHVLKNLQRKDNSAYLKFRKILISDGQDGVVEKWLPEQKDEEQDYVPQTWLQNQGEDNQDAWEGKKQYKPNREGDRRYYLTRVIQAIFFRHPCPYPPPPPPNPRNQMDCLCFQIFLIV